MARLLANQYFSCCDHQDPSIQRMQQGALRSSAIEFQYRQSNLLHSIESLLAKTIFAVRRNLGLNQKSS